MNTLTENTSLRFLTSLTTWHISVIFLANLALKLIFITDQPIWYDECFSIFFSQGSVADTMAVSRWDINPPFYYLLLKYWMQLFGNGEFSVRFINVLFSSLAAIVLFLYVRKFINPKAAWIASVLFILSDVLFRYSHEVRGYSWIILCGLLSSYWFIKQIENPSYLRSVLLACSWYALFMTNYLTFFILLIQGVVALLYFRKIRLTYFLCSVVFFAILIYHWTDRLYEIITQGQHSAVANIPTRDDLYNLCIAFLDGEYMLYFWIAVLVLSLALLAIQFKTYLLRLQLYYSPMVVYSLLLGILPIIVAYNISHKMPMFLDRYLLFTLIGLIPLLSVLFVQTLYRNWLYVPGVIIVIVLSAMFINLKPSNHMNYRDAVAYVKSKEENKNRLIIVQTIDVQALFTYYYDHQIFNDRFALNDNLKKKEIYSGNDSTAFKDLDFQKYEQVLLLQTYENYTDPAATVDSMLSGKFHKLYRNTDYEGVVISEYKKR